MKITAKTRVRAVLRKHPRLEELLSWLDIILEDSDIRGTMGALCDNYDIDMEELLADLLENSDEDEDVWSSLGNDDSDDEDSDEDESDDEESDDDEDDEDDDGDDEDDEGVGEALIDDDELDEDDEDDEATAFYEDDEDEDED